VKITAGSPMSAVEVAIEFVFETYRNGIGATG
jgi:hypothetical protein